MKTKSILVTGGSSAIGQSILSRLEDDFRLLCLVHRNPVDIDRADVEWIHGGLSALAEHEAQVKTADTILHMAAVTHADSEREYMETNVEGTRQLLATCRRNQLFIYLSTRCIGPEGGAYSHSKYLAENLVRESGLPYVIIRPSEVYNSNPREGIDALIRMALGKRLLIDLRYSPELTYSPISRDELVWFIVQVVKHAHKEKTVYTVCNHEACTVQEMQAALKTRLAKHVFRAPVPLTFLKGLCALHLPTPFKYDQIARPTMQKSDDNSTARADYGFAPRSFLDYLAKG